MPWKTAVNAAVSLYGTHQANKNIDKQLQAQQRENSLNRLYNLKLAKMQNKWNLQQWQMENAYNSPAAQMERMRQAGLNPDMMYGGGVSGNLSANSPEMTSGAPSSPVDWSSLGSKKTIGDTLLQAKQLEMMDAQIDKTKEEARGAGFQADILASDARFRDAINQGSIDLTRMQIRGISSDMQVNNVQMMKMRAETRKLNQETENLLATFDKIKAEISNLDADTAYKKLRAVLDSKETNALIEKMAADTRLTKAECRAIVSRLPYELLGLQVDAAYTSEQTKVVKLENNVVSWQFEQDKNYDDWKRSIGIAGDAINALEGVASIIGTAFGAGKPTRVRGFRR